MITLTLYSKPDCHLCDEMKQVIAEVGRRHRFELVVRNILDDPAEYNQYRYAIPVLKVNGAEVARYRLAAKDLEAALSAFQQGDSVAPNAGG